MEVGSYWTWNCAVLVTPPAVTVNVATPLGMPCELMSPVRQAPSWATTAPPVSIVAGKPPTLPTSVIAAPGGSPEKAHVNDVPAGPDAGVQLAPPVT